jgi:hypothetical protein
VRLIGRGEDLPHRLSGCEQGTTPLHTLFVTSEHDR